MKNTISAKLFATLQKGKEQLSKEALSGISRFVESQRTEEGAFKDKSGKADLYYTSFGWTLSYLLGLKPDLKKMASYLAKQDTEALDLIHYTAYIRCRMILWLMKTGKAGLLLRTFFSSGSKPLEAFDGLPHNDPCSPYTQFIWFSLQEDMGQRIRNKREIIESLLRYHRPERGFTNTREGLTATTNATTAAFTVIGQLTGYGVEFQILEILLNLCGMQKESGGFCATKESPVPDLLSTATSLFLLNNYGMLPPYPAKDFIEAHWLECGGFSATLMDSESDVEYTFYGLLALGAARK